MQINKKLLIPILSVGVLIIIINFIFILTSLFGLTNYWPVFQTIGLGLVILYGFDILQNRKQRSLYFYAGIVFILFGIFFQ
ncbi:MULTISPECIES: hypothetical protein [unclassified Staphylococcus]|uniref:hypothetical protein n=1 Tax=unclassified Staphylococcus TaxID=91994 RepID=UPI0021D366CE|nr:MULTISPECIES: hypothetical protein [unclassified Staphylococcus]UXR79211.1 hypothetical protein MUA92_04795 [Staphylococcus sp. IVB6227]UXR83428.1 hypothetical protein MUA51_05040 [Staphylococcus sp. IVB6214]